MTGWKWRQTPLLVFALLVCFTVTGCAPRDTSADDDRRGGFYGGISGGMTRP